MDIHSIKGIKIDGIVACVPKKSVSTIDSCMELYGEKGVETLMKATGIITRRIANEGTTTLDLCCEAADELLNELKIDRAEIGGVVCVTFSPQHIMPADAPSAQHRLNLNNDIFAFDINMACSGYGYGLYVSSLLAKQINKKVLLLDGDVQTAYVNEKDKSTMPVLSDCGSATLISPSNNSFEWKFAFYTDGSLKDSLFIPVGGSKYKTSEKDIVDISYDDGSKRKNIDMYMNGFEVFKFVSMKASKCIKEFMDLNNILENNLDIWVPHQANIYMISELTKKLKIDKEKMWKSGDVFGNPGSSSVPLTIATNAKSFFEKNNGDKTLFSGFGGGMSISIGYINLNNNGFYKVIDY